MGGHSTRGRGHTEHERGGIAPTGYPLDFAQLYAGDSRFFVMPESGFSLCENMKLKSQVWSWHFLLHVDLWKTPFLIVIWTLYLSCYHHHYNRYCPDSRLLFTWEFYSSSCLSWRKSGHIMSWKCEMYNVFPAKTKLGYPHFTYSMCHLPSVNHCVSGLLECLQLAQSFPLITECHTADGIS